MSQAYSSSDEVLAGPSAGSGHRGWAGSSRLTPGRGTWVWLSTVALLFMVTKGPVFWLRRELAPFSGDFIDDRWVQSAFVCVGGVVIALAASATDRLRGDPAVLWSFMALGSLVLMSAIWSVDRSRTVEQGLMMLLGTAAALLAGASQSRLRLVAALWTATHLGLAFSVVAWWREWPLSVDTTGRLAGIYFTANSLGPVAIVAAASGIALLAEAYRTRRNGFAAMLAVVAVLDLVAWSRTGSLTPLVGFLFGMTGVHVMLLFERRPELRNRRPFAVMGVLSVVGLGGIAISWSWIVERMGRVPTLSGRTEIWQVVLEFVAERPVLGWGFMAPWTQDAISFELTGRFSRRIFEAHSGFMEMLLGVGIVGLALLIAVTVVGLRRVAAVAWDQPDPASYFMFGVAIYFIVVNLGETYVGANLLPWIVFVMATGSAVRMSEDG